MQSLWEPWKFAWPLCLCCALSFVARNWITVGGIRSTGVSASLGIAQHVAALMQDDLQAEPTRGSTHTVESLDWKLLPSGTLVADGQQYGISHPITLYGMREGVRNSRL